MAIVLVCVVLVATGCGKTDSGLPTDIDEDTGETEGTTLSGGVEKSLADYMRLTRAVPTTDEDNVTGAECYIIREVVEVSYSAEHSFEGIKIVIEWLSSEIDPWRVGDYWGILIYEDPHSEYGWSVETHYDMRWEKDNLERLGYM